MTAIIVELNGQKVSDTVEPRQTLADFLRDRCGLTATHLGCEHGACGACTVVVDGIATRSCLSLAVMSDGRSVVTLEGLHNDPVTDLLRRHFHECHALQCGFCTPGMLIMARDILLRHTRPDAAAVREGLSGQICRCTGYANIVKAIVAAGLEMPEKVIEEPPQDTAQETPQDTLKSLQQTLEEALQQAVREPPAATVPGV